MNHNQQRLPGILLASITVALLLFGPQTTLAQQGPPTKPPSDAGSGTSQSNQPRLELAETSFNFGEVEEGETIRHDFRVRNSGLAELQITQVSPG